jgi:hypothetical protein
MKLIRCDRCGATVKESDYNRLTGPVEQPPRREEGDQLLGRYVITVAFAQFVHTSGARHGAVDQVDLCPRCIAAVAGDLIG